MIKKVGAGIIFLFSGTFLHAQTSGGAIEDVTTIAHITVPSPSVASLYKFSDVPVNLSNGSVNIAIPIYTIQAGSITWPVTLKYNGSGIRVNEHAGNVGLGWNLDAEGAVVQSVLGRKDNGTDYLGLNGTSWDNAAIMPNSPENYSLLNTLSNVADGAPDLYVYNLHNQSGKFVITESIKLMPKKDIEITSYNNANGEKSWKIIDESGVAYYFEDMETNQNRSYGLGTSSSNDWLLSKVIDPVKGDTLFFEYEDMFMTYSTGANYELNVWTNASGVGWEWSMLPSDAAIPGLLTNGIQNTTGKQLKRIRFPEGSIEYDIAWNSRQDWPTDPTAAHVPQVKNVFVKDKEGDLIKTVHFDQSYFVSAGTGIESKRLRLDSVSIADDLSNAQNAPIEKYKLKYNSIALPPKNSYAIDHWGYYNGKTNNETLIPSFSSAGFHYYGADRSTYPSFVTAGMLEQITYPTGGTSTFSWESHRYNSPVPLPPFDSSLVAQLEPEGIGWVLSTEESATVAIPDEDDFSYMPATLTVTGGYPGGVGSQEVNHAASKIILYEVTPGSGAVIKKTLSLNFSATNNYTKSQTVYLTRGKSYYFKIQTQGTFGYTVFGKLEFEWPQDGVSYVPHYVGGCRIAKIRTHDINTDNDLIKKYQYSDVQAFNTPVYSWLQYKYVTDVDESGTGGVSTPLCTEIELPGFHLSSNSMFNMGIGNHVGYTAVSEIYGENGQGGYKTSTFTNYNGDRIGEIDATWRHGLPIKEEVFDASSTLISRVVYHNKSRTLEHYAGHTATPIGAHPCSNGLDLANILQYPAHWTQKVYDYPIDWMYTDTVESTDFITGIHQTNITGFDNTNHMLPTRKTSFTSDNKKITTFIQYPTDFDVTASTTAEIDGIKLLQDKHMHTIPIETYVQEWLPGSSTPLTLSAKQYEYVRAHNILGQTTDIPLLKTLRSIDIAGEGINNFYPMDVNSNVLFRDPKYVVKSLAVKYDGYYNLEKLMDKGIEGSGYLWGYNGRLTIATVKNLDTAKKIAYTSFENNATGNWYFNLAAVVTSDYFTGERCINIGASNGIYLLSPVNTMALPSGPPSATITGSYIVSYWHKNGSVLVNGNAPDLTGMTANGWTYCEHYLTGTTTSITFTGTGLLDELRLYPAESLMKSFTYKPMVGVTSANDESNSLIFYEYDALGRLKQEKDVYGNVLKSYTYQTQGPQ